MKVYELSVSDEYQMLAPDDAEQYIGIVSSRGFNGRPLLDRWPHELPCHIPNPLLARGELFGFTVGAFAWSRRAAAELTDLLRPIAEMLPLACDGERYPLVNVTRQIDVIDQTNAIPRVLSGKWVAGFDKYAFQPDKLTTESIFRIPQEPGRLFTVTEHGAADRDFLMRCASAGFRGLDLRHVWSGA